MIGFMKFLEALSTAGGNLLILVFFDILLIVIVGEPWLHYNSDEDKLLSTILAGFAGATLQALTGGRVSRQLHEIYESQPHAPTKEEKVSSVEKSLPTEKEKVR